MRQQHHIAEAEKTRVHGGLVLEDVEAGARDLPALQGAHKSILIDDLAAGCVHDIGLGLHELQPTRVDHMECLRRVRTMKRHDVDLGEHRIEVFPIGGAQFLLDHLIGGFAVVVVNLKAECSRPLRHRLADPAHADNTQTLAGDAPTQHP